MDGLHIFCSLAVKTAMGQDRFGPCGGEHFGPVLRPKRSPRPFFFGTQSVTAELQGAMNAQSQGTGSARHELWARRGVKAWAFLGQMKDTFRRVSWGDGGRGGEEGKEGRSHYSSTLSCVRG